MKKKIMLALILAGGLFAFADADCKCSKCGSPGQQLCTMFGQCNGKECPWVDN